MRLVIAILILAVIELQYKLWFGEGGFWHWRQVEKKLTIQEDKNNILSKRNQSVEAEIVKLKQEDNALEEKARTELGMIKNDEVYYQFID